MYKKEFIQKYLTRCNIPNAVLFYGDSFLIDYYAKKTLECLQCNDEQLTKCYFDEYHFTSLYEAMLTPSLFASREVFLLKINKKIPKKELSILLERKSQHVTLIVCFYKVADTANYGHDCKEMESCFSKGISIRLFEPNVYEAGQLLQEIAKTAGLQIENNLLMDIYHNHNGDFYLIESDILKLATLGRKITAQDIKEHIFGLAIWRIDELCLSLFQKKDCITIAHSLFQSSSTAREILVGMESFFMRFFLMFCYKQLHHSTNQQDNSRSFMDVLGYVPPLHVQKQFDYAMRIGSQEYRQIFDILQHAFLAVLQRGCDTEREVFSALIKLKEIIR